MFRVVIIAPNCEAALTEVGRQHFYLVFLNLKKSGMNDLNVMNSIKDQAKDIVVLIVTKDTDDPAAMKALAQGPLLMVRNHTRNRKLLRF